MYMYLDGNNGHDGQGLHEYNDGCRINGYFIEVHPKDRRIVINLESNGFSPGMTKIEMGRDEAIKLVSKLLSVL